jgi:DeoR/GlpR family transcriptional regulator of sugar metabolism
MAGLGEARRTLVAELLQSTGAVTITDLQDRFGVSPMTARRDLTILAERGVARRTHGGAVLPSIAAYENSFSHRLRDAPKAKLRLAEQAFTLLREGETVFLDASTTTYFVARLIAERGLAVRVITNSLPVLQELAASERDAVEVVVIGGTFRRITHSHVGPSAVHGVRQHFADRLFMSVTGVTGAGTLTDVDVLEAEVKRAMIEHAEQSVLLLDHSKLAAHGRQAVCPVSRLSLVITDGVDAADRTRLTRLGATLSAAGR